MNNTLSYSDQIKRVISDIKQKDSIILETTEQILIRNFGDNWEDADHTAIFNITEQHIFSTSRSIEIFLLRYFNDDWHNIDHTFVFNAIFSYIQTEPKCCFWIRPKKFSSKKFLLIPDNIKIKISLIFDLLSHKLYLSEVEDLFKYPLSLHIETYRSLINYICRYSKKITIYDSLKFKSGEIPFTYYNAIYEDSFNSPTYIPNEMKLLIEVYHSKHEDSIELCFRNLFRSLTITYSPRYRRFSNYRYRKIFTNREIIITSLTDKIIKNIQITNNPREETDPSSPLPLTKIIVFDSFHKIKEGKNDLFITKIKLDIHKKYGEPTNNQPINTREHLCRRLDEDLDGYFYHHNPNRIVFENSNYQG